MLRQSERKMRHRVSLRLDTKDTLGKIEMGKTVLLKMTGNSNFPTPNPDLPAFKTVVGACEAALTAAINGSKQQKAELVEAEALLEANLVQLAAYVDNIANGSETLILGAGFETEKAQTQATVPAQPLLRKVVNTGIPLALKLFWARVKFATTYQVEQNDSETLEEDKWRVIKTQNQVNLIVEGLISGKIYGFRLRPLGSLGWGNYSNVIQARVL